MESMTRASATPARGSASLPGSERGTPTFSIAGIAARGENHGSHSNLRAADFGAKIKELEETGCRLRGEVDVILKEKNDYRSIADNYGRNSQIVARKRGILKDGRRRVKKTWQPDTTNANSMSPENRISVPLSDRPSTFEEGDTNSYSIRDLADISNEQRTIDAMKSKLDEHSLHAESLQNRVRAPSPKRSAAPFLPSYPSRVGPLIPNDGRRVDLMLPPSILERELRDARQQNDYLKGQLDGAQRQHSAEAQEARHTIDDLKSRLYDLQTQHEQYLRAQEEERQNNLTLVSNLRESLQQLQSANREQEQALLQTNQKVDQAQQNYYILESALSQLRGLLVNVEQRRGRPFFDTDPVQTQSGTMLVHCVERCLQEHAAENDLRISKLRQMELAMEEAKKVYESRLNDQERQHQERLSGATREAERKQQELREAEASSRRRADALEEKVRTTHEQLDDLSQTNRSQKSEYTARINDLMRELERQANAWNEKRSALEDALDASQRETVAAMSQKEQAAKEAAEVEAKLQRSMMQRAEVKAALDEEQSRRRHASEQCAHMERQLSQLAQQVEEKRLTLMKMEDAMERARAESAQEISRVRLEERAAVASQKEELNLKAVNLTEDLEQAKNELMEARAALNQFQTSLREATESHNMLKIQLEGLADEKGHLQSIIGNRSAEVERLTSERDYYFRCLDEKTEEVSYLKAEKQRLITQSTEMLDKLEENFRRLEERLTDLKVLDQERSKQYGNYHQEKESLQVRYAEKDRELEALRTTRDSLVRRLKAKEKQIKEMELDRERGGNELKERRNEVEAVYRERNQLFIELKESRQEALNMANEMEMIRAAAREREAALERQLQDANERMQESQQKRCRNPIEFGPRNTKDRTNSNTRLCRPNGRIQKEVSTNRNHMTALQLKMKELEDNAVSVEEEHRRLKEENTRLVRLMERLTLQNEKLSKELEYYLSKNQELLTKVSVSETAAEDATKRCRVLQRHNDGLEAELSALRFKTTIRQQTSNSHADDDEPHRVTFGPVWPRSPASADPLQLSTEKEVLEIGEDLRHMIGDVRSLLAEHTDPSVGNSVAEFERRRDSPVGQLLVDRQHPVHSNLREDSEEHARRQRARGDEEKGKDARRKDLKWDDSVNLS